jgi:hypothetical protein
MVTLAGSGLAALVLVGQAGGGPSITGTVVDPDGKPIAGIEIFLSSGMDIDGTVPTLESATSDREGRFRLAIPPRDRLRRLGLFGAVWAYRPGSTLALRSVRLDRGIDPAPVTIALRAAARRTVTVRGSDGKPLAGARVGVRAIHGAASDMALDLLPDELARRFSAATDAGGKATFDGLSPRDDVVAVRIAVDGLGAQDFELVKQIAFGKDAPTEYAVTVNPPGPIAGRVVDGGGRPIAGVPVEVWTRGETWMGPTPLDTPGGPARTAADGSFRTSAGLLVGSSYRVVVRAPGRRSVLSGWAKAVERSPGMPDLVLRSLRTIGGRLVDRRGRPIGGVEVFQAGDGPEPTSTRTDDRGKFALAGFREGLVFLFARAAGFRFHGQLVKDADASRVEVVLTRETEAPATSMATLPDPIPPEESRALAREVLAPCLEAALAHGDDSGKYWALQAMVKIDPAAVLERLDSIRFERPNSRDTVKNRLVIALAATDPDEAAAVAESIAEPGTRAGVLVDLADELPASEKSRKLAVLDQAVLQAKAATNPQDRLFQMGEVAERWYELGEIERARALFAEARAVADGFANKSDPILGLFAARLSHLDLPGALRIAEGIADQDRRDDALGNIAARIAAENPAEVEGVLGRIPNPLGRIPGTFRACQKMAAVDPARARRIAERTQGAMFRADALLFLAVGLKGRDRRAAVATVRDALAEIDRFLAEGNEDPFRGRQIAATLPLVEQVDPALVPEFFWRVLSTRPRIDDPRRAKDYPSLRLVPFLARYDRDVAAVLFDPSLAEMNQLDEPGTKQYSEFVAWSLIDPRAAATRLKAIAPSRERDANSNWTFTGVADCLALSGEARWKWYWRTNSGLGGVLFDRDVW